MRTGVLALALAVVSGLGISLVSGEAMAQTAGSEAKVLDNPSLDDLRDALFAPTTVSRAFRRTAPPTTDGLCPGAGATVAARPDHAPVAGSRNLEVVPFAGAEAQSANLAVQFANNSDAITPSGKAMLNKLAQVLNEPGAASARFAIAGHTDATGGDRVNLELSCARAIAARQYLIGKRVAAERLSAYGFGSSKPLQAGGGASAANRRVEVRRAD